MSVSQKMLPNLYRDSVSLMQFSEKLKALPGIRQASAVMATENNINLLLEAGLLDRPLPPSPNDLLIVMEGVDENSAQSALEQAEQLLKEKPVAEQTGEALDMAPRSLVMGLERLPGGNLVLISTPGEYAAAEALKALHLGLNVMLFSDNVSLSDEILLKQYARDHDLLVMGPDCGTAIINGIPLGFANVIRSGNIGVVAASGTGLQQVTCLIDRWGGGISQAIGTGSHDLHVQVGGITMRQGIAALADDPATQVIVLISKPPAPGVARQVLDQAAYCGKPVVVDFIGADLDSCNYSGLYAARTLDEAARMAIQLAQGKTAGQMEDAIPAVLERQAVQASARLKPGQRYIRGLFSGGTFCYESLLLLDGLIGPVYSNIPLKPEYRLVYVWKSQQHTAIDLGDDLFTQGRPHPMIDFRLRNDRMIKEAGDLETGVILLDVVLGYGSNMDPAAELVPAIAQARKVAGLDAREIVFIGSVCGTQGDPQNLNRQESALREAGVLLAESNAQAARLAASVIRRVGE